MSSSDASSRPIVSSTVVGVTGFRRVLFELRSGREVDAFITIVAAVALSVLNVLGLVSTTVLQGTTSALLALIAVNLLVLRSRLDESEAGRGVGPPPILTELNRFPEPFEADMNRDGYLWIGGGYIGRLNPYYIHHIRRRLQLAHTVRLLLVDPDSPADVLMGERFHQPIPPGWYQEQVRAALSHIEDLAGNANGNLEVRLTNDELAIGWTHLGLGTSKAKLYVQYFGYRPPGLLSLKLILTPRHGEIYDFHMAQLEALWEAAIPWSP